MNTIITLAIPLFSIIAAGILSGKLNWISVDDSQALNRFVFRIAAALFGLTLRTEPPALYDLKYAAIYGIAALTILITSYYIGRRFFSLPKPDAGVHAFSATLANAVFLGVPISQGVEGWGKPFVVLMLVEGLIIITVASFLIAARVDENQNDLRTPVREIMLRPFKNPLVVAPLLGFLLNLAGVTISGPADSFLIFMGRSAGPVALFSMGLFLSTNQADFKVMISAPILQIILFKLVALPALVFIGMSLAGLTQERFFGAVMLITILPTGIVAYIQASARGRYIPQSAAAIAITTIFSILTISGALYFLA